MVPATPLIVPVIVPSNFGSVALMTPAPLAAVTPFSLGGTSRLDRSSWTVFAASNTALVAVSRSAGGRSGGASSSPEQPVIARSTPSATGATRASGRRGNGGRRMAATVTAPPRD